jgi:hypothetical protein
LRDDIAEGGDVCCSLGLALALRGALIVFWLLFRLAIVRFVFIRFVILWLVVVVRFTVIRFLITRFIVIGRIVVVVVVVVIIIVVRFFALFIFSRPPVAANMTVEKVTKKTKTASTLGLQNITDCSLAT